MWEVLYGAWVASEIAILLFKRARTRAADSQNHDRGSLFVLWPVVIAAIWLGTWYGRAHPPDLFRNASEARIVSIALLAFGLAIRWMAILKLGRSFTANVAIQREQRIETGGVFRFIRHPSYAGLLIIFTGIAFNTRSWIGFAIVIVPITAALLYRIQVEERALSNAFGEEYRRYCRSTKRLIPGLF